MRLAKENIKLAELYYKQAMKRMLKDESEQAAANSEQNAQIQQASMMAKAEAEIALDDAKSKNKRKEILMQGFLDLKKANLEIPTELKPLMEELVANIQTPLIVENDQMEAELEAQAMEEEQMAQEQQLQTA
jgi:hypothetical protein